MSQFLELELGRLVQNKDNDGETGVSYLLSASLIVSRKGDEFVGGVLQNGGTPISHDS